ncbi:MAG TPA: cytochrome c oxidase assembly protein [Gaiellaceae bacterium]|jgi:cytochrome c oxidase assembly factor CtaG|nr:cytochrome c oxidase assembly protein [Gaiellaceae bacterium]
MPLADAAWSAPPAVLAAAMLSAALFAQGWLRLRRRGRADLASWGSVALFAAGLATALAALVSPIDSIGESSLLSVHMLQHVLLGDVSAALLVTAVRGPLLMFLLPAAVLAPLARSPVRAIVAFLARPPVTLALWAVNLAVWHIPRIYDAALAHPLLHDVEHALWAAAGLLVWTLLVDPGGHRRLTTGGRVAVAAGLFAAGQVLTDVLVFSFHPLYPAYRGAYGVAAHTDQQLAGVVMMVEQLVTLGTFVALVLRPRVRVARLAAA